MQVIFGLVLIIIGAINALDPKTGWHMSDGWKYKNAEPSEEALLWGRIGGIVTIIIGFVMMFDHWRGRRRAMAFAMLPIVIIVGLAVVIGFVIALRR